MKVLHICLTGPYNDGWNYQENALPLYQKKMGFDVTVVASCLIINKTTNNYFMVKPSTYIDKNGITIIRLPYKFLNNLKLANKFKIYSDLYTIMKQIRPNYIFCHGIQFFSVFDLIRYKKANPKVKLFIDSHADLYNSAKTWLSKNILHRIIWGSIARYISKYTEVFWGVTPSRCEFLKKIYKLDEKKIEYLELGAEDDYIYNLSAEERNIERSKLGISENEFVIVTGGKLDKNKYQILLVMKAFNIIKNENLKLIIFGSISNEFKNEFYSLLNDKIKYIGWIEPKQSYKIFEIADIVIFPGLHSVFWEQVVGIGIPAIFKYIPGFTHIKIGNNCKFLYNEDPNEIASILKNIALNNDIYLNMKKDALGMQKYRFRYSKIAAKSLKYES